MKKIYVIYRKCINWINGDDTYTPKNIIEEAIKVLSNIKELEDVWQECVFHINNWDKNTIEEQCERDEVIMEDLCGYLGEYLQN